MAPQYLENLYSQSLVVKSIFVSVKDTFNSVVAVIFPDIEVLIKVDKDQDLDFESLSCLLHKASASDEYKC